MMTFANRVGFLAACLLAFVGDRAPAQSLGLGGRGVAGGYGPGMENLLPGSGAGYLPSGGGFLPYTPGRGGGLGVQSRMTDVTPGPASGSMAMPGAPSPVGEASGRLSPLSPIRGLSGRGGMGSSLFMNRSPGGGRPGPMPSRPPVGFYPFQIPPGLGDPASQRPAMSM